MLCIYACESFMSAKVAARCSASSLVSQSSWGKASQLGKKSLTTNWYNFTRVCPPYSQQNFTISCTIAISLCSAAGWIEVVVFQSSGSNRRRSFLGNCTVMRVRKPPAPATSCHTALPHGRVWMLSRVSSVLGCSTCLPKAIYLEETVASPKPLAWELAVLCIWHSILQVVTLPMKESVQYESVK